MQDSPFQKRILVIKLGALGDFIQSLGPMRAIRQHHPVAHITLLTTKPFEALGEKSGYFDSIQIDVRPKWHQFQKWIKLKQFLNRGNFSRVYDLQNNDRTGLYFKLLSPKPEWVGIAKGASHRNTSPERTHGLAFHGHVQTLGLAGVSNIEIDQLEWMDAEAKDFSLSEPYALIIPGSAPSRPEKRWPAEQFAAVCTLLLKKNIQPVLIGTDAEKDVTGKIIALCPDATNLTGQTSLYDIAALARKSTVCIGNDTGPMHIIGPTGAQTAVLFTRHSNPKRHAPLGKKVIIFDQKKIEPVSLLAKIGI